MATNKGRSGGRLGVSKAASRRALSKTRPETREPAAGRQRSRTDSRLHGAGRGGAAQRAGGPEHHGADAWEDRNP
jgi:hypothetical protein